MRVLFHVVALLVGVAVAVSAVVVHRSAVLHLPIGLTLGLVTTFVTSWAMRELLPGLASSYAVGWVIAFGFVILGRPEGDYAVASDLRGYALMAAGLAMVVVGVTSVSSRHPRSAPLAT